MKYPSVVTAKFIRRANRFIAYCRLDETNETVEVHVKNTGRGKEVLLPEASVALNYSPSPKRKTDYDLIAVKKRDFWINIDSQLPNHLVQDGLKTGIIRLPDLSGSLTLIKPETVFQHSKFDFYLETELGEKAFLEVKGMTLENFGIGAFPDAPTLRGLKHVEELKLAIQQGYKAYVLFAVQFEPVKLATIHKEMQPALADALEEGMRSGLHVLAYNSFVAEGTVQLKEEVPFDLTYPFIDPNQ